jgi:putative FmdB family regulatory protein
LPLYPYRCTECGHRFEKIQHFGAEPLLECPKCHGVLERTLTAPAFKFKGSGFYVTDYGGKNSAVASDPAPAAASAAAKAPCAGNCGAACPVAAAAASGSATN